MVPAGEITERAVTELATLLEPGDTILDGGNTRYHDDIRRARELGERGIHYVDVGTSGGVYGLQRGFCLMVGGDDAVVDRLAPLFTSLAPGVGAVDRTPGRTGEPASEELGWLHCGPAGAGHFVKMVHNGIEYGLMAAYAEGLNLLHHANAGATERAKDAETAPLGEPEHYRYDLDVAAVARSTARSRRSTRSPQWSRRSATVSRCCSTAAFARAPTSSSRWRSARGQCSSDARTSTASVSAARPVCATSSAACSPSSS